MFYFQLHTLKAKMIATANNLDNKRKELKNAINEIEQKHGLVERRVEEIESLRLKLDETRQSSMTADQRVKKLEQMIEDEERNYKCLVQDHSRLQTVLYKNQQNLYELDNVGIIKETAIANFRTTFQQSKKELTNYYTELEKRKEIAYNIVINYRTIEATIDLQFFFCLFIKFCRNIA